jgi:putative transposase
MVASIIRTIFAGSDREHIEKQFTKGPTMLGRSHPKVAAMLDDARPDLLAFAGFPRRHWRQIWSTNLLNESTTRSNAAPTLSVSFPNPTALLRLAGAVLVEQHDE